LGTITIAGQTVTITQGQGCTFAISPETRTVPASGADGTVAVAAGTGCAWTAASDVSWITIASGTSGNGNGSVSYKVAATTGPARTGTMTVAGRTFTVNQDGGCSITLSPVSQNVGSAGGNAAVGVAGSAGCAWTAASNVPWITIASGGAGAGSGTVQLAIAANAGPERQGTVTIAGQTATVVQAGGCTYSIAPSTHNLPAGGGAGSFSVNAAGACAWTAVANAPWISITSGAGGTGPGTVQFTAAANASGARSGTITAAGQTFTVTQDAACNPVVAPETITAPAAAGSHNVSVTTAAECAWTATSNAPWIAIATGMSGTGNGTVQVDVQANSGPSRSGTVTIAGRTVSIGQEAGCTFAIAPATQTVAAAGGSGTVAVTAGAGCAWTAVSNAPWVTVTKGASGTGGETVEFAVQANATGAPRTGTMTIAGQTFTIEQSGM
jgi:hypothetical protein